MEQKYNAPIDKVFALLTDPKWLEDRRGRSLARLARADVACAYAAADERRADQPL